MFAVIYTFEVLPGKDDNFIETWCVLTKLIKQYDGSYGSRLHLNNDGKYIAYALWETKKVWEQCRKDLSEEELRIRQKLRKFCQHIEISHEMDLIEYLEDSPPSQA